MTTHDWQQPVDVDHIVSVRQDAARRSVGGSVHLVLEVLAYALDEAAEGATRSIRLTLHADGSVSVVDDGRGTDTRRDDDGTWVVKPVMATRDLRFFDVPGAPVLPDGLPRAGMSVVAALSSWLEHTNVRSDTAWSARYVRGLPEGPPVAVATGGPSATTVRFMPDPEVFADPVDADALEAFVSTVQSAATVQLVDQRGR